MKYSLILAITALAMSGCSVSATSDGTPAFTTPSEKSFSDGALSGKVLGKDWALVSAFARPFGTDGQKLVIHMYAETVSDACTNPIAKKPYATVVIPKSYAVSEYKFDLQGEKSGEPMVFSDTRSGAVNLMAEQTRVRINAISSTTFEASIYGYAIDERGSISEINGKATVLDCTKTADFNVWEEVVGWYTLTSFDGKTVQERTSIIDKDSRNLFYDRSSSRYLKTILIPLYSGVSDGSDASLTFGPMSGLGTTTVSEQDGAKTYTYTYRGPVNYRQIDIVLNLDITVVKRGSTLSVNYTIEIPSHITSTSHRFTLRK